MSNTPVTHPFWSLRTATTDDRDFLRELFASTRADEEPIKHWPAVHRRRFLELQHEAQTAHYRNRFASAERWIIDVAGENAGRLILNKTAGDVRVVDISLLPGYRGRGLGTAVLRAVFAQAAVTGASVSLSVLVNSPALRLYRQLGFHERPGGTAPYIEMSRPAEPRAK